MMGENSGLDSPEKFDRLLVRILNKAVNWSGIGVTFPDIPFPDGRDAEDAKEGD
jgi:hypothetical protein